MFQLSLFRLLHDTKHTTQRSHLDTSSSASALPFLRTESDRHSSLASDKSTLPDPAIEHDTLKLLMLYIRVFIERVIGRAVTFLEEWEHERGDDARLLGHQNVSLMPTSGVLVLTLTTVIVS